MLSFNVLQTPSNPVPRKILVAAPFPPDSNGLHGGSRVIGGLIDELLKRHSVAVAYFRATGEPPMEEDLARRCAVVEEVPRIANARLLRLGAAWARGFPMWVEDWNVPAFRDRLNRLVKQWQPDVAQFEFHVMAQYVDAVPSCATILVEHEPGTSAARDRWRFSSGWRRTVLARDMRSWEAYERKVLPKFNAVVCFTASDRDKLLELSPGSRVEVIPPRGPAVGSVASIENPSKVILFVGNFVHPPNVDAGIRLAQYIFPIVRLSHSDAELQLVGDAPPPSVRRLAGPGIVVTGRVPDMTPFLEQSAVVVAPLRMGGGIRIKVMEALAFGKAVVGTALSAEGLEVTGGQEMLIADSDQEIAAALCEVLSNPALRRQLSTNARDWAARFGTPGRVADAFEQLYRTI